MLINEKSQSESISLSKFKARCKIILRINTAFKMRLYIFFFASILMALSSCTPHREMVILQDIANQGNQISINTPDHILRTGDILHVRVLTIDQESRELFNVNAMQMGMGGGISPNAGFFITGFTIDDQGFIELPIAGKVSVGGLTMTQAREALQQSIDQYLVDATVNLKLVNFTISILGEVNNPGMFYIYENSITILEALSMARDMTDFGSRNVTLVRRNNDMVTFHTIDLNSRDFMTSEFYFMQPGDLLYVEPKPIKRLGFAQFPFSVVFSAITTALVVINFLDRN